MHSDLPMSPKKVRLTRRLVAVAALSLLLTGSDMAGSPGAPAPEIWFFLRPYAMMTHGVDGQQGWQKLFMQPGRRS